MQQTVLARPICKRPGTGRGRLLSDGLRCSLVTGGRGVSEPCSRRVVEELDAARFQRSFDGLGGAGHQALSPRSNLLIVEVDTHAVSASSRTPIRKAARAILH